MEKGGNSCEGLLIIAVQNGRQQGVQVASLGFRLSCKQRGGRQPFQKSRNRKGIKLRISARICQRSSRRRIASANWRPCNWWGWCLSLLVSLIFLREGEGAKRVAIVLIWKGFSCLFDF
jgi:hypothetical protein